MKEESGVKVKLEWKKPTLMVIGTISEITQSSCGSSLPKTCGCPPGPCPHEPWTCS